MRLREKINKQISKDLKKSLEIENNMLIPRLEKVVLNVGCGKHAKDKEYLATVLAHLSKISGQKAVHTLAKKSISAFKTREGMIVGAKVTLRGNMMYDFVEKLVAITFPRVRDFRGIDAKAIDNTGNMTLGFKDQSAFPEISVEDMDNSFGLEICLNTSAKSREDARALFDALGFPFKKEIKKESK